MRIGREGEEGYKNTRGRRSRRGRRRERPGEGDGTVRCRKSSKQQQDKTTSFEDIFFFVVVFFLTSVIHPNPFTPHRSVPSDKRRPSQLSPPPPLLSGHALLGRPHQETGPAQHTVLPIPGRPR